MWLANLLTLSRIPLAIVFCATYGDRAWSFAVIAAAALTDALDGAVARRARARAELYHRRVSSVGEWLDPVADKVFVVTVAGTLATHGVPLAIVLAVCTRELLVIPLGLVYRLVRPGVEHAFKADAFGKATTIAQMVAVTGLVAQAPWAAAASVIAGALGIAAVAHYVMRGLARPRLAA
jgi:cardiolipin synthase